MSQATDMSHRRLSPRKSKAPARADRASEARAEAYERRFAAAHGPAPDLEFADGLPLVERRRHEAALGADLSDVTVARSRAPAKAGAAAMAEGRAVLLAPGAPRSGLPIRRLIAHEIAHIADPQTVRGPQFARPTLSLMPVPAPVAQRSKFHTSLTVYFGQGSFLLGADGQAAIARLRTSLRLIPGARVHIDGYASAEGSAALNEDLSQSRRWAVRALLTAGMPENAQIGGRAFGEAHAAEADVAAEDREDHRARHRKVEITILRPLPMTPEEDTAAPVVLFPKLEFTPETDSERLNRILRTPLPDLDRPSFSVCGAWKSSTKTFFDHQLRAMGVGEKPRKILTNLGVGAIEKLPFKAIEQGLKAGDVGETEKKAILKAVEAACKQEVTP